MAHKGVPVRDWVPLDTEPLFDQLNGKLDLDAEADDPAAGNLRRLIDAGIITTLATGTTMGGW